jgi:L-aspartate oxidase
VTAPIVIAGAGIAGLWTALQAAPRRVVLLTGWALGANASTAWAQGGVAAALSDDDSPALHAADTISAGAGLVNEDAARLLAEAGPAEIEALHALGAPFEREADGRWALSREAAHSRARVARVKGDQAGAGILAALIDAVRAASHVEIREGWRTAGLLQGEDGGCAGLIALDPEGRRHDLPASATVLATGSLCGLYAVTTTPWTSQGQALAWAARLGAAVEDAEFVQFHPTAIDTGQDPAPLATEALRGEGAVLIDRSGHRFMRGAHADAELAPRDVVARAVHRQLKAGRGAFLDARAAVGEAFPERFPAVFAACMAAGIDPRRQPIPVAPAAHYHMGGIATDLDGFTGIARLYAVGECASTGLHGANRLASNSLLDGLVFGRRAAEAIIGPLRRGGTLHHLRQVVGHGHERKPPPTGELLDGAGEAAGQSPAVAKAVFEELGVPEIVATSTSWDGLIPGLQQNQFDILAAGVFITPERCQEVSFSEPTATAPEAFMVAEGNPFDIQHFEDIAANPEIRLAVLNASVEQTYAEYFGVSEDQMELIPDQTTGFEMLQNERVDAISMLKVSHQYLLIERGGDFEVTEPFYPVMNDKEEKGWGGLCMRQGSDEMLEEVNRVIAEFTESGRLLELGEEWGFTEDDLPDGTSTAELCEG